MSYFGGLLGGINQTNKTLTSILTLSDGFTTISGGNISGVQNISTSNITILGDLIAPEIETSSIITPSGTLTIHPNVNILGNLNISNINSTNGNINIGSIGDNINLIGSNISLIGNVSIIESQTVTFVDNNLELNVGGGNILLEGSGLSVMGDGNALVSSLVLDENADWVFHSPNEKLTVENLSVGNLTVENPIVYDNFEASNITASNKLYSNKEVINNSAIYSQSLTHLNVKNIKSQYIRTQSLLSNGDIQSNGNINSSFFNALNGLSFNGGSPFRVEYGTTNTVDSSITITFNTPFNNLPTVLVSGFRDSATPPIAYIRGITNNDVDLFAKNDAGGNYGNLKFTWIAIGF